MNIRKIFLIQMEYRLQSIYNHMVGRTASVISPFYSLLSGLPSLSPLKSRTAFYPSSHDEFINSSQPVCLWVPECSLEHVFKSGT